jgi:hypothetical protein
MAENLNALQYARKRTDLSSQQKDLANLLYTVVLESRGEGKPGMFAVARSIINRRQLILDKKVLPSTFMPGSKNKNPTFTDIITHKNQYSVIDQKTQKFAKQKSPIRQEDLNKGMQAIQIALNNDSSKKYIADTKLDPRTYDAVNFRRVDAKYDASQQKQKFVIGNHEFNLSGSPFADKYKKEPTK